MAKGRQAELSRSGLVVAGYGRRVVVEAAGQRHECMVRGRKLRPVCGDRVTLIVDPAGNVVTAIEPRRTALTRPDRRGREEVLAANIDQLVVVVAPRPAPDPFITDRYLAAARLSGVEAAIVLNKIDLDEGFDPAWLEDLVRIGYPLIRTNAKTDTGVAGLAVSFADRTNILVGQSGVGKSSLLNALLPDLDLRTGSVSAASGEGRHTTTASVMHRLANGGWVIDSPGVRDYAPATVEVARVATGYLEVDDLSPQCRFHNCVHDKEPGCAVLAAVASGAVSARRYESYRRLLNLMRQLGPG